MVLCKSLEMSKKKMRPSIDEIAVIMIRERMPATGTYDTVKSTTSSMDYPTANIIDYISY